MKLAIILAAILGWSAIIGFGVAANFYIGGL